MSFRKYITNGLSYIMPTAFGGAGSELTDTDGAGTLDWEPGSAGGSTLSVKLVAQGSYTNLGRLAGKTPQVGFNVFSNPGDGGLLLADTSSGGSYDFDSVLGKITFAVVGDYVVEIY